MFFAFLLSWIQIISATEISVPELYVQQQQHTAFFAFGVSGESLITHCILDWPDQGRCYFKFVDSEGREEHKISTYTELQDLQAVIISDLLALQTYWQIQYPLGGWGETFSLFRRTNHESLQQLISEIQTETLPMRVLMLHEDHRQDPAYFYDEELVQHIFAIFKKHLRHD